MTKADLQRVAQLLTRITQDASYAAMAPEVKQALLTAAAIVELTTKYERSGTGDV